MKIPEPKIEKATGLIPDSATIILKESADTESEPLLISYRHYLDKHCGLNDYNSSTLKKSLNTFRIIGKLCTFSQFQANNIKCTAIKNAGDYKKLFNGLSEDIDLLEHKIGGTERIFFWIDENKNRFYLRCLTKKHFETKKTRR